MKAIETIWKGYRFRSRTEARWAVFLEAAGLQFEYEPEGVILPSGPYLPDFRFQTFDHINLAETGPVDFDRTYWLEIKGEQPTTAEMQRCAELAVATDNMVFLAVGAPDVKPQIYIFTPYLDFPRDYWIKRKDGPATFAACSDRGGLCLWYQVGQPITDPEDGTVYPAMTQAWLGHFAKAESYPACTPKWKPVISPNLQAAYDAARGARFEFGQTDKRWP